MQPDELKLVSAVYDAVLSDDALAALSCGLARHFEACSATLTWRPAHGDVRVISQYGLDPEAVRQYEGGFYKHDVWIHSAPPVQYERAIATDAYVPLHTLERTLFYNEFLKPNGDLVHGVGVLLRIDDGLGDIGVHRTRGQGPFSPEELAGLERLIPSLRQLMVMRTVRPAVAGAGPLHMLDQVGIGAAVLTSDLSIVSANAIALQRIRASKGLRYTRNQGLSSEFAQDEAELRSATERACATGVGGSVRITQSNDVDPIIARVIPYRPGPGEPTGKALLFFRDPAGMRTDAQELFATTYKLSAAEAAVGFALARGMDIAGIAAERKVRVSTVRSQIAALMSKTGTQRQSQIVSLIAKLGDAAG